MSWTPERWKQKSESAPAFLSLGLELVRDIRKGKLASGDRLPSSRVLATQLKLHRNTVLAAYAELEAQGWIETAQGRGTFVSADLPEVLAPGARERPAHGYRIRPAPELLRNAPEAKVLSMAGGLPDTRLVSTTDLSRTIRRVLSRGKTLLDYGSPYGVNRLRRAIAQMLRDKRGMVVDEESVLITRGSQMGIYLLGQALLQHDDVVAVESIGYRPAFQALRMSGARLAPVPVDNKGMQIEKLEELHKRRRLRAVYLTPHHQFPTLVTLSASRRLQLLEFAKRHRIAVLEDDYDHEFHYEGRPIAPISSEDSSGNLIYIGTLSKVLAPGLRIGYVVAPKELIDALAAIRSHIDSHGDAIFETALAEWIEEGDLERHARRVRRVYLQRRHALDDALRSELGDRLQYTLPNGGMALWVQCLREKDADAWAGRALQRGVRVSPGSLYRLDRRNIPYLRMGFAKLNEDELLRAVKILARSQSAS